MTNRRLAKEIHDLLGNLTKKTKGQAKIFEIVEDSIENIIIEIAPKKGPYRHGKFKFNLIFGEDYPSIPPDVISLNAIYHPNIVNDDSEHNVCLNLFDHWTPVFGIEEVIQGLIFLLYHPNLLDPMISISPSIDEEAFINLAQRALCGEKVEGYQFEMNYGWAEYEKEVSARKGVATVTDAPPPVAVAEENETIASTDTPLVSDITWEEISEKVPQQQAALVAADNKPQKHVGDVVTSMDTLRIGVWDDTTEVTSIDEANAGQDDDDDALRLAELDVEVSSFMLEYCPDFVAGRFTPPSSMEDSDDDFDDDSFSDCVDEDLIMDMDLIRVNVKYSTVQFEAILNSQDLDLPPVIRDAAVLHVNGRTFFARREYLAECELWELRQLDSSSLVHCAFNLQSVLKSPRFRRLVRISGRSCFPFDAVISSGACIIGLLPWLCSSFSLRTSASILRSSCPS